MRVPLNNAKIVSDEELAQLRIEEVATLFFNKLSSSTNLHSEGMTSGNQMCDLSDVIDKEDILASFTNPLDSK